MILTTGILAALIAALIAYAATRPDKFSVQRAISIAVPSDRLFPFINDFHRWQVWSPWEKLDLAMKKSFSGAPSGKGAVYEWEGNDKVGQGRMEITESSPSSKITIQLDFVRPFKAHNIAEFTLEGISAATTVVWAMHGRKPFVAKLMGLFLSMDKMVGKDFEKGLANLKAVAESIPGDGSTLPTSRGSM